MIDMIPQTRSVGIHADVAIDVVAWDAVGADVDISFACMFEREVGDADIVGGLKDLDEAMEGGLLALRSSGTFRGNPMETLHLKRPPARVRGKALMLVGLGDPSAFSPDVMEQAARLALREAVRLNATSAALAPGMLDSGLRAARTQGAGDAMLAGVIGALDGESALAKAGLTTRHVLTRWVFDAGAAHLDAVANGFRRTFTERWAL